MVEILKKIKNSFKSKPKKIKSKNDIKAENFLEAYAHFMYKYFGRDLISKPKFNDFFYKNFYNRKYEGILKKANLKLIPDEYFITIFLTIVIVLSLGILSGIIFLFINVITGMFVFYGSILAIAGLGIFLYNYPVVLSKTRRTEIDASIPYLLPYMKILSKELNLSKIIDIIEDFLIYKEIRIEFQRIKYYYTILGYDIHSSIRLAMESCPSRQLADILNDMVTISNSGGNIYSYLDRKLDHLNQEIDAIEKKSIDTLLIYSQIYVVILLIAPLFYTIMSSILSMIDLSATSSGGSMASASGNLTSIIVLLIFLPLAYIGFMMLVYYSKPLYSRLKPIKDGN